MSLLIQSAIYLSAGVIAVAIFSRLGFGSVLGYLAAGVAIGPWGLALVGDVDSILHFSEFGVVLLLFIIGLELQPARLWTMRHGVFGAGGAQMVLCAIPIGGVCLAAGLPWQTALTIGLGLSLSSTAFALQALAEKGQLTAQHGRTAFSILLFQDMAAIPIIAIVPLLASVGASSGPPGFESFAKVFAMVAAVILVGHFLLRHVFRLVARTGVSEIFTTTALLTVIGVALLMESVGLSMALGAFLAGVLLADSEFRHALEANIEPFKGLLLGLFFMAVGMAVNFGLLTTEISLIITLVIALMSCKFAVLVGIGVAVGLDRRSTLYLAVSICQGGEFAFVIFGLAVSSGVMPAALSELLILAVTLSMACTTFLFLVLERMLNAQETASREFDVPAVEENRIVIAGFGRFGQIVGRLLQAKKIGFTALEISPEQVDFVRKYGNKIYYGDASRLDLLKAARVDEADYFVLAIDNVDASVRAAETVARHFPHVRILARARNREHVYRLMDIGVTYIYRETFSSSLEAARDLLTFTGRTANEAENVVATFRRHDEERLIQQHGTHHDAERVAAQSREWQKELEQIFEQDAVDQEAIAAGEEGQTTGAD
ncbi:MAG: glutathione-regulated potassium-efflux system protein KefB [Alphaproteobacteria bacterium]|nr:glutathione-regulated potassium-efflux system protein KefB [Alphaproteobacteria bacterium]